MQNFSYGNERAGETHFHITADRIAQLVERRTTVREVSGSSPDQTNTQGLKITEENMLPLQWHLRMVRYSSLL